MREIVHIECPDCGNRNYTMRKNKAKHKERLEIKKFCKHCRKHTVHKETK